MDTLGKCRTVTNDQQSATVIMESSKIGLFDDKEPPQTALMQQELDTEKRGTSSSQNYQYEDETQIVSGHMFDTVKSSFYQNTTTGRVQVHSFVGNSEETSQEVKQEAQVSQGDQSETLDEVRQHRFEAAPAPHQIVIKTAKTGESYSLENSIGEPERNRSRQSENTARPQVSTTTKTKGSKISLKHYKQDTNGSLKRPDFQSRQTERGFHQMSSRISKKPAAPQLFSGSAANHRLSNEIQQATMFQQSSMSRESSVEHAIPFVAEEEDFVETAAAAHQKNKIQYRSVNFRQPQQVSLRNDNRSDKRQSPLKQFHQSHGKSVAGKTERGRQNATSRRQMTNLQNRTHRIFPSHQQIEQVQSQAQGGRSKAHHQKQRKLKEITVSSASNLNPSTNEYMAVEQYQGSAANEIAENPQQDKSYYRSQSQTLKHDAGTQLGTLPKEPMNFNRVHEMRPDESSSSLRQSPEAVYYQNQNARLPETIDSENKLAIGESQTDFGSPSLTEWKQVRINTHMLGNSLDTTSNNNTHFQKKLVMHIRNQSKSGSILKTSQQQSEEGRKSIVNMDEGLFGHIPIFSEQQESGTDGQTTSAEGPGAPTQTGEFELQSRGQHGRTHSTKTQQKTLFGNYLTKEFLQKRSDLQFGAGAVNKNLVQQQLFTAVHRPQQFSRDRLVPGYAFNKDLPSTLVTNDSEQSATRQSKADTSSGNNIMINTGPVTSHTVMLNLFPTTSKSTKQSTRLDAKHYKSKAAIKEDLRRLKQTYRQTGTLSTRQQSTSSKNEISKLKIGSTVISATSSKDKALKYKVQKKESEAQYTTLKFPLSNRRLEATRSEVNRTSVKMKNQGIEIQTPRNIGHLAMHSKETLIRKESHNQLKIEGNTTQRKFFKAEEVSKQKEEEESQDVLQPLTIYQLQSTKKRTMGARDSHDHTVTTLYKPKEPSFTSTASKMPSKLRLSRGPPDYSATFSAKSSRRPEPTGGNSCMSSVERERTLTQMGHFGPKMIDPISHIENELQSPQSIVSRSKITFATRQTVSINLPPQDQSNSFQPVDYKADDPKQTGQVREQKTVLNELRSLVTDSTKQLKDIQLQSQQLCNRSAKGSTQGSRVLQQGSSLMVQVGMQRVIEMQQEYIAALELHQAHVDELNTGGCSSSPRQAATTKAAEIPSIQALMTKKDFLQTTQILKTTLEKIAKLNKDGYRQLEELQVETALQTTPEPNHLVDHKSIEGLCREESLETLGEFCQSEEMGEDQQPQRESSLGLGGSRASNQ